MALSITEFGFNFLLLHSQNTPW